MKNLFDDFMEELRRRQADMAAGRDAGTGPRDGDGGDRSPDADEPDPDDAGPSGRDEHDDDADGDGDREPIAMRPRPAGPGGPRRPPARRLGGPDDGAPRRRDRLRGVLIAAIVLAIIAFVTLAGFILDLITDAVWFKSVGYDAVFFTRLGTQAVLFAGVFVAVLLFLTANLWLAARLAPPPDPDHVGPVGEFAARLGEAFGVDATRDGPGGRTTFGGAAFGGMGGPRTVTFEADALPDLVPVARWGLIALAVLIALTTASAAAGQWETVLLWRNQVPFSPAGVAPVVDPVFGRDIGFYLFELPFLRTVQGMASGLLIAALVLSLGRYLLAGVRGGLVFTTQMRVHLAVLGGLYLLTVAVGYQLDKLELVYSTQGGSFVGVSFTDQNARFLAFDVLTAISAFAGAFLVIGAFTRAMWPLAAVVIVWFSATIVLGSVYPGLVQRFSVEPDQLNKETPYIANNIAMTRQAFQLNDWQLLRYNGEAPLTPEAVAKEAATFQNARLWDYRPLQSTLDQLQVIRQYYTFTDVDTDRYDLNGSMRQVMLSARELAPEQNPAGGTWVNQRITFTHGIGAAMVPVNAATSGGQPELIVRDLPPVSSSGAPVISQPRIYFGERPSDWIITGAQQDEFDYPVGTSDQAGSPTQGQTTRWSGTTGISLQSTLTRLLFALRFRDLNLLISDQITQDSQILFHRSLADRLPRIAPFLQYDKDPYLAIGPDGGLFYIQDAYTTSDLFPDAQSFDPSTLPGTGLDGQSINYIRNSVKVVENAYTGDMKFYVADPNDPIIRTYERIFPGLFIPLDQMPAELVAHLRVPEEMFNVQTQTFARYHVTDPSSFYNNEDRWTVPENPGGSQNLANEAYYVEMRPPNQPSPEFLLLQPMVPAVRPNMIAWVAARMDAPNYGEVQVYRFPQDTSVLGPNQIQAKIDADPIISAQTTLWDQSGSKVIRGNLIVMPIQDSLIYLQPVYLQSANSAFPGFERIIVATSTKIVWGPSLSDALQLLFAGGTPPTPTPAPSPGPGASPTPTPSAGPSESPPSGDVAALIAYANDHFNLAQAALRAGDFATYGSEMAKVQEALRELSALSGASPSPAP